MSIFNGINISGSALTAQRLRMDVISSNMANADTTRATLVNGKWVPYRRKTVEFQPISSSFGQYLSAATGNTMGDAFGGVEVTQIGEDPTPFNTVYDPESPDADANGYVQTPNVDPLKEMTDMISASRSYEANVTVLDATKGMLMKALEIGK